MSVGGEVCKDGGSTEVLFESLLAYGLWQKGADWEGVGADRLWPRARLKATLGVLVAVECCGDASGSWLKWAGGVGGGGRKPKTIQVG